MLFVMPNVTSYEDVHKSRSDTAPLADFRSAHRTFSEFEVASRSKHGNEKFTVETKSL